jgi:hypothetical protein
MDKFYSYYNILCKFNYILYSNSLCNYVNSKRINIKDENVVFFFSIFADFDDLIRLGTGSENDHFRVCMSSIKLLRQCAIYQITGSAYCIDGTYKITFEEFVLVVFGRTDMKRRMHPIAFMLVYKTSWLCYM